MKPVCLIVILALVAVLGDAPMDCGTLQGFQRIFEEADLVIKATPLQTKTLFCQTNISQFTVRSIVRGSWNNMSAVGATLNVYRQSDTPGLFPVATDMGDVLLMLHAPSEFDRGNDTCGDFPAATFALADCGRSEELMKMDTAKKIFMGDSVCKAGGGEACMNQNNWEQCRQQVDSGCDNLIVMESCPVQFACVDSKDCCLAMPSCSADLAESRVPCCPGEAGCTVETFCCETVYCRPPGQQACVFSFNGIAASFNGIAASARPTAAISGALLAVVISLLKA